MDFLVYILYIPHSHTIYTIVVVYNSYLSNMNYVWLCDKHSYLCLENPLYDIQIKRMCFWIQLHLDVVGHISVGVLFIRVNV